MKEPQKIFFDGELIGEVPATDNLKKVLVSVREQVESSESFVIQV
jgi:hypothetical protein